MLEFPGPGLFQKLSKTLYICVAVAVAAFIPHDIHKQVHPMEARLCGLLLVMMAYALTAGTGMMALNDPCVLSCGPDWMSPAGNAVFMWRLTQLRCLP